MSSTMYTCLARKVYWLLEHFGGFPHPLERVSCGFMFFFLRMQWDITLRHVRLVPRIRGDA